MRLHLSGLPFDPEIMATLSDDLVQNGYSPEIFRIEKHIHPRPLYGYGPEYDYTVGIEGKKFTITFANDDYFAKFFFKLCCSDETHHPVAHLLEKMWARVEQDLNITKHWLTQDPLKK
jgi:hypothetical protein